MSHGRAGVSVAGGLFVALVLAGAGCNQGTQSSAGASGPGGGGRKPDATGLFISKCAKCHRMGDVGGGQAPDLTHAGSNASHTAAWIAEHIKNPRTHTPQSMMPAFGNELGPREIESLAEHLAARK